MNCLPPQYVDASVADAGFESASLSFCAESMNNQAFDILEYDELKALVRREAQTPMGRAQIEALGPIDDLNELSKALATTAEGVELRRRGVGQSFDGLSDASDSLSRLRIHGTALDPLSILELARLCDAALAARAAILAERAALPLLWAIVGDLPRELNSLVARIRNKILPNGELDDRASPELARIRHEIARLRSNITRSLENLMRRSEDAIQDELVTVRNDRFVIPVRADHRGRVQGVAHGFSSSGATVFIEPLQTIEANNELQTLRGLEEQEIAKILWALSDELRTQLPAIELAAHAIAELDFINAKARFHQRFNCTVPEIEQAGRITDRFAKGLVPHHGEDTSLPGNARSSESLQTNIDVSSLELKDARHPLLEENLRSTGAAPVPVSFSLNDEHTAMVISGANAGGKTVVLKTAGLLSLMALSGLPVPAREAQVPFYASVLADIGDHQSLAANLSTFTSHVANIARMIELCQEPALVLLDEVGTGTDPEEGSALGVAVVDHFRRACRAHVMASTHYGGLKMYAANEPGVLNASVEFDEKTLRPTYRLIVGLAGASSGLEIARRFGIPNDIIQAASRQVAESSREATLFLRRIKQDSEAAAEQLRALEEERAAVAEKYALLDSEANQRERERQQAFEDAVRHAVAEFERRSRELISKVEDRAERLRLERETQKHAAELKREAQRAVSAAREPGSVEGPAGAQSRGVRVVRNGRILEEKLGSPPAQPSDREVAVEVEFREPKGLRDSHSPNVGDRVRLRAFGKVGIVDRIKNDEAEVRVGSLHLREKLENLEVVEAVPAKPETGLAAKLRAARGTEVQLRTSNEAVRSELNVIGQTTDVAADAVDKFLDEAFLNNLSEVRIVHGHGTGALRRAIGELLKGHPHVARVSSAPPDQGGAGATIVELKQ